MREPTVAVAPVSAMTSGSSSEDLARMAAAASRIRAPRSSADHAAQPGWASLAAAAAARASSALAFGARPTSSSVAGFTISYVPSAASTHLPPIRSWCSSRCVVSAI